MAKIVDPDLLVVGTELTVNTAAKTFTLNVAGNLVAKDGVSLQALYSKFKELWLLPAYQPFPFPMYAIDAEAGKYQFGTDGDKFSDWKPSNDATRNMLRDGGWEEYTAAGGAPARVYVGIVTLGVVGANHQLYYQRAANGVPRNFVFTGPVNEGVQVFGNATNGNFDERAFFKVFAREYQFTYAQSSLADIGETATGPRKLAFAVQNQADLKITANDATVDAYGVTITYYGTNQNRSVGGTPYPFRVIIDGNGRTAEEIYSAVQSKLRKDADIDAGAGVVNGKTADALLRFVGDTLVTSPGVYIDNYNVNDTNRIEFYDQNNALRKAPFVATGTIAFNSNLKDDVAAVFAMYFKTAAAGDYGTATAVVVQDADGDPISGDVPFSGERTFDFAYDSNAQRGAGTAGTDATVVVVAIGKNSGKYVSTEYTITRSSNQRISLVAEKERSYANAA